MTPLERLEWLTSIASARAPLVALVAATEIAYRDGGQGAFGLPGASLGLSDPGARKGRAWLVKHGFVTRTPRSWSAAMPNATALPVAKIATPGAEDTATPGAVSATPGAVTALPVAKIATPGAHNREDSQQDNNKDTPSTTNPSEDNPDGPARVLDPSPEVTPMADLADDDLFRLAKRHVATHAKDPDRREELRQDVIDLARRHGRRFLDIAAALRFQHNRKPWPEEIEEAIAAAARPKPVQYEEIPDILRPLPPPRARVAL